MTPPGPGDWQRASPFAIVFFVASGIKKFARALVQALLPVIAVFVVLRDDSRAALILLALAGAAILVVLVIAVIQWSVFRFRIAEDRLLIRKGVIRKSKLDLPYERVQGINVERSLIDRMIGLVTLTLDTSGSVQAEGQLPSIRTELADHLRTRIVKRHPAFEDDVPEGDGDPSEPGAAEDAGARSMGAAGMRPAAAAISGAGRPDRGDVLLRLGGGDMVRIGLANRNFIFVAALVGLLTDLLQPGDLIDPILEAIAAGVDSAASAFSGLGALAQVVLVAVVVLGAMAAALLVLVTAAFLRYHDFTLWHDGRRFRSRAGLLTQREVVVEAPKVQQLTVSQGLVLRWLGRYGLRALPAAFIVPQSTQTPGVDVADVLDVPLLGGRTADDLRSRVFGEEARGLAVLPGSKAFKRVSPHYIRALTLRIALVSALFFAAIFLSPEDAVSMGAADVATWWLATVPVAALIAWQRWRRQGYMHDRDGVVSRSGLIGKRVDAFLMRKAQSAMVRQSPLQRRKGLATLQVQLACGRITVPYIDRGEACRLRDRILYMAEASRQRWH